PIRCKPRVARNATGPVSKKIELLLEHHEKRRRCPLRWIGQVSSGQRPANFLPQRECLAGLASHAAASCVPIPLIRPARESEGSVGSFASSDSFGFRRDWRGKVHD